MKRMIIAILLFLMLFSIADARLPQKGDHVKALVVVNSGVISYEGTINDIDQGMICLNCTESNVGEGGRYAWAQLYYPIEKCPFDICIGTGSIISLAWP
jgi:hypothetical protein